MDNKKWEINQSNMYDYLKRRGAIFEEDIKRAKEIAIANIGNPYFKVPVWDYRSIDYCETTKELKKLVIRRVINRIIEFDDNVSITTKELALYLRNGLPIRQ